MIEEVIVERLFPVLISGDRTAARAVVNEFLADGKTAEDLAHDVFWPILEMIDKLFRADQITTLAHHYGTRLLRTIIDQTQMQYTQRTRRRRSVLVFSGPNEQDELSGLLMADLAEGDGYDVRYGGSGVANDEILSEVGERKPDVLLMFASGPQDAPNIRVLIDTIRSVDACPDLQIVVGGGVFNRADGLAEEIGADLWARTPREILARLDAEKDRRATDDQRTVGRAKRAVKSAAA